MPVHATTGYVDKWHDDNSGQALKNKSKMEEKREVKEQDEKEQEEEQEEEQKSTGLSGQSNELAAKKR